MEPYGYSHGKLLEVQKKTFVTDDQLVQAMEAELKKIHYRSQFFFSKGISKKYWHNCQNL